MGKVGSIYCLYSPMASLVWWLLGILGGKDVKSGSFGIL
jgi:hypothetical protein